MMEVVATAGAIRHANLQSNRHHQQTKTQLFYRLDALPVTQPTINVVDVMAQRQRGVVFQR